MGRKPSVNLNTLPGLRHRVRRGKTYYYYDTGGKPRKEIPLGTDYVAAVRRWSELRIQPSPILITVAYAIGQYLASPQFESLATGTQADYQFALDKLLENFGPAPLEDVRPSLVQIYMERPML